METSLINYLKPHIASTSTLSTSIPCRSHPRSLTIIVHFDRSGLHICSFFRPSISISSIFWHYFEMSSFNFQFACESLDTKLCLRPLKRLKEKNSTDPCKLLHDRIRACSYQHHLLFGAASEWFALFQAQWLLECSPVGYAESLLTFEFHNSSLKPFIRYETVILSFEFLKLILASSLLLCYFQACRYLPTDFTFGQSGFCPRQFSVSCINIGSLSLKLISVAAICFLKNRLFGGGNIVTANGKGCTVYLLKSEYI
ncbi:unnamed protein product [Albugo candida]|uniref:Uncharacterized protein n=1 Tax=Albugo candida TaxID=65357 RepID=A0A024GHS1_9STRA|nr:unnamed protein product [Albugo candida]|eukprot:CCI46398.1 unnamed protein product [Albugo candida]